MMTKSLHHVGMSVSDLDRAIGFYRDGLGMRVVAQSTYGPGKYDGKYEQILGLKGATGRVAMLAAGTLQLELFEFSFPKPKRIDSGRPLCDHGISHFGIEVEDIAEVHRQLADIGATFHCPPLDFEGKAIVTFVRDPDGNAFELLQWRAE